MISWSRTDFILLPNRWKNSILNASMLYDAPYSNHRPVTASLRLPRPPPATSSTLPYTSAFLRRINARAFADPSFVEMLAQVADLVLLSPVCPSMAWEFEKARLVSFSAHFSRDILEGHPLREGSGEGSARRAARVARVPPVALPSPATRLEDINGGSSTALLGSGSAPPGSSACSCSRFGGRTLGERSTSAFETSKLGDDSLTFADAWLTLYYRHQHLPRLHAPPLPIPLR